MTNRENQNGVVLFFKAVERDVASPAAGYDQLAHFVFDRTAKQGMTFQQGDGLFDEVDGFRCGLRIACDQKVGQPFQIDKRSFRIDQLRHDLAFGFVDFLPAMRALR